MIKRIYKGMILGLIKEKDFRDMLVYKYDKEGSNKILENVLKGKVFKTKASYI